METIETFNYKSKTGKKLVLKLEYEIDPINPREDCDNLGTMVCFHRRYNYGDTHYFESIDSFLEEAQEYAYVYLPIYMYDHSGVTISSTPFSCRWDSGLLGYIYVTPEQIKREYSVEEITPEILEKAKSVLETEIKIYDTYIKGDVYYVVIEDRKGEHINSLGNMAGYDYVKEVIERTIKEKSSDILQ